MIAVRFNADGTLVRHDHECPSKERLTCPCGDVFKTREEYDNRLCREDEESVFRYDSGMPRPDLDVPER